MNKIKKLKLLFIKITINNLKIPGYPQVFIPFQWP